MDNKSFKINKQTEQSIANYNKTVCFDDSLKKKFKELLSVFDTDGSGNLETKNKNGKNEIEVYFDAVTQAASKTGDKLELDIKEAQNLIDNVIKNPKIKAKDLVEFSGLVAKTIDVSTVTSNIQNFANRNGMMTKNISALSNITKNQINSDNVLEILEKYKKTGGQSFFDLIADYKFVDNDERKGLVLDVFNKLIQHAKLKGKDVELLQQLGTDEIKYQFDKTGFIDKDNVNAFFEALTIISKRKTTDLKAGNDDQYVEEFKIPKYEDKKETIGKIEDKILNKVVTYSLSDGTKINEGYYYDSKKQEFVMESRTWLDKAGNNIKIATYYAGDENSINSVHFFENNEQVETHFYKKDGKELNATYSKNGQFRNIMFGQNGTAVEDTRITDADDISKRQENINYYGENGELYNANASWDLLFQSDVEQLASFYSLTPEEPDWSYLPNMVLCGTLEKFDKRTQKNIMEVLFQNCEKHPAAGNATLNNFKNQSMKYIDDGDLLKAYSCYLQAQGRATAQDNRRLIKESLDNVPINGKIDRDFKQSNFGTCWLTSAIKSLTLNPNGQKILDNTVKHDTKTGDIIVTLKGAPEGQQVYRYTQKQIQEATELSIGDGDERAIEMAFGDLFLKYDNKYGESADNSLNGNDLKTASKLLTGKDAIEYVEEDSGDSYSYEINSPEFEAYVRSKLDSLVGKKNLVAQCSFVKDFDTDHVINNQGTTTSTQIYTGHAYSLKAVDKDYVYVINPWDTSKTEIIARKDFEKYCPTITILDI